MIAFADAAIERIENRLREYAAAYAGAAVPDWLKHYARDVNFLLSLVADLRNHPAVAVRFEPPTPEEDEEVRRLCEKYQHHPVLMPQRHLIIDAMGEAYGVATPLANSPDGVAPPADIGVRDEGLVHYLPLSGQSNCRRNYGTRVVTNRHAEVTCRDCQHEAWTHMAVDAKTFRPRCGSENWSSATHEEYQVTCPACRTAMAASGVGGQLPKGTSQNETPLSTAAADALVEKPAQGEPATPEKPPETWRDRPPQL